MTQDLELLTSICWKVSNFIATRDRNDEFGLFQNSLSMKGDVYRVMREYPAHFISPPKNAYANLYDDGDLWTIGDDDERRWYAEIPLWSEEEGRSDLCLKVTINLKTDPPRVVLHDCLVS
jgi:hypothetical protein